MIRNIMACLVHEKEDAVWDMARNLRCLDPSSRVLLYNNSGDPKFLSFNPLAADAYINVCPIVPRKPLKYGVLHPFMLDCMRWALDNVEFDTITNVDSDQLLLRPGYSEAISRVVEAHPRFGMLSSPPATSGWPADFANDPTHVNYPEACAHWEMWRLGPILDRWRVKLAWSFWPGTCFGHAASRGILNTFQNDSALRDFLENCRLFATEEVILPTIVSHLRLDLVPSPFNLPECVRFQSAYSADEVSKFLADPNCQWIHPVPRDINTPIRARLRLRYNNYSQAKEARNEISR